MKDTATAFGQCLSAPPLK